MNPGLGVLLLKTALHRLTRITIGLYLFYLAVSTLFISPYINWQVDKTYSQLTGRRLHFEAIHFNPFSFSLTLRKASDRNPDESILWSAQSIYINIAFIRTLINLTPTIEEIRIEHPYAYPQRLNAQQWNFDDILQHQTKKTTTLPTTEPTAPIPTLAINHIQISQGKLQFTDNSLKKPVNLTIDNLAFEMKDFVTTSSKEQPYLLRATLINADTAKTPGELLWQGNISLNHGYDQGTLAVKNILLSPFWTYTKPLFNFTLHSTNASVTSQYRIEWADTVLWSIQEGQLLLENIGLTSGKKNARNVELTANQLLVDKIEISSQEQSTHISSIVLDGMHLKSWSNGSESGVIRAFTPNISSNPEEKNNELWSLDIGSLKVKKGAIDWQAAELEQHNFKIRKLNVTAQPIALNQTITTNINLTSRIDKSIKFSLQGDIDLNSLNGTFNAELEQFPLVLIKSLVTPYLHVNNLSGLMDTRATIAIENATPTTITTHGKLVSVKLHPATNTQELLTWENLSWSDVQLDLQQEKADIPLMLLSKLDGRMYIFKDGTTNLQGLLPQNTDEKPTEPNTSWQFTLHKLELDKASFRFHDESLTPNFTAAVQNFSGTMTQLSSNETQAANFSFNGDVDGYAPVQLQGKMQPFLAQPLLDAQLDFENMDLGGFSGYSSTYAGWRIERGLLTANLHYRLNDGLVEGDNHIEMDQLQLGERVRSGTAMDIPLRLALALITDENGLATLDIGISGKTDDPQFNVRKVIWSAVRNSFKKIIKSPFKLLAKLVGSKEDLGELPFNSGSSKLLATATRKLNALQQAMNKRPELRIELRGSYDPVTDTRGLQMAQLNKQLLTNGLNNQDIKVKNQRWQTAITREYRKLEIAGAKNISAEKMQEQLLQSIPIPADALTQLASTRSINAKQFLVQHLKIDNNRVLISARQDCDKPDVCNRRLVKIDLSDISQISLGNNSSTAR